MEIWSWSKKGYDFIKKSNLLMLQLQRTLYSHKKCNKFKESLCSKIYAMFNDALFKKGNEKKRNEFLDIW